MRSRAIPRMVVSIQISTAATTSTVSTRRCWGGLIDRSLTVMTALWQERQVPVNSAAAHNGRVSTEESCSTFLVRHAWLSLRGVVAEALVEHDLSVAQFASLLLLRESPGMSVADVA